MCSASKQLATQSLGHSLPLSLKHFFFFSFFPFLFSFFPSFFFFSFFFLSERGHVQGYSGLPLGSVPGSIPGGVQGARWYARDLNWVGWLVTWKASTLLASLSPAPTLKHFLVFTQRYTPSQGCDSLHLDIPKALSLEQVLSRDI